MRLLRLDLLRYGLFTQKSLTFRPGAKVHVVYGPNEAGKSTALSAIGDLLYGFPNISPYNFSGEKIALRLGAEIVNRAGHKLTFHRIKSRGLPKTLRTPEEELLPDNALQPYIGQVDKRMFVNAFGLSTEALRLGSRAMLDQEGEIGAALLGAASGVGDLQALQKRLDEEANGIFKPRKSGQLTFWQAHQRFKDANDARKQSELTAPKWKQLNGEIEALAIKLEALKSRLHETSMRSNRLTRLTAVRPIMNRIAGHLAEISALGQLALPTPTYVGELGAALEARANAAFIANAAAEACFKAENDLAAISLDEPLIASGRLVDALAQEIGSYKLATDRIGEAEETSRRAEDGLSDLLADLGLATPEDRSPAEALRAARPSVATLERARALIVERDALDDEARNLARAIADEEETFGRLQRERDAVPSLVEPGLFRSSLEALESDLAAIAEMDDLALTVANDSRRLVEEAGRLSPEASDLDRLSSSPRPSLDTVQRFRIEFDRLLSDRDKAETNLNEARQLAEVYRQNLAQLENEGEVITQEALQEARNNRDLNWSALRHALLSEERPNPFELASSIATFETATVRADAMADTAIRDAQRIEAYRQQSLQQSLNLKTAEDKIKQQSDSLMLNEGDLTTLRDIWADEWRDISVSPTLPAEMADWLVRVEALLERRELVERQQMRLRLMEERAASLSRPLGDLAAQMGLVAIDGLTPQALATRIKARLSELTRIWDTARDVTIRLGDCLTRLDALRAQDAALTERIAVWEPHWNEAMVGLGLRPGADVTEARATLGVFERLPRAIEMHTAARRQLDDLTARIGSFAGPARELTERLAPDLDALSPEESIARLAERLREARDALARREGAELRLADARTKRTESSVSIDTTQARLIDLTHQAGLAADVDLADFHARFSRFEAISEALSAARRELAEQALGETEDELRASLADFDLDASSAEKDELSREQRRLEDERLEVYAAWDRLVRQRDELESGSGAELSVQRRMLAESDLANLSREWLVLKLAATLVAKATARHRAGHHVPLVERAGHLFERITGGSFSGLATEIDERGQEHLVGRRPNGDTVDIGRTSSGMIDEKATGGMSEGTLDQLYLAMRLAHLEEFARSSEPAPFIGDDLFITFDDARTALGLEALAEVSDLIQPIIFTHHARVADIARQQLGQDADVITI